MFAIMMHIGLQEAKPMLPEGISSELRDLLVCCFKINPGDRPSATELLKHRFILDTRESSPGSTSSEEDTT
jgi:serine/threonine protein kinase